MTPEEFEKLDPKKKQEEIDRYNETEREWWVQCPKCGLRRIGTLRDLRGQKCPGCSSG